jgi:L-rhamnose mutarotase
MDRVCFLLKVKKDQLEAYLAAHEAVWPEMLRAMHDSGIRNYSMYQREDGLLVGYLEAEDTQEALRRCAETDASRRWHEYMAPFFESVSPGLRAGEPLFLPEYFYMA